MKYADRVQCACATTGTGTLTLDSAISGFRDFSAVLTTGDEVCYLIRGATQWEVGRGVFTSPSTLTRATVLCSNNSDALVDITAATRVSIVQSASRIVDSAQVSPVATLAALAALDDGDLPNGTSIHVLAIACHFTLSTASALTVDGITVVSTFSGTGRWLRTNGPSLRWQNQDTWYIDAASGNDEGDGSIGAPIASLDEWDRRTGQRPSVAQTIRIVGDYADSFTWRTENTFETRVMVYGTRSAAVLSAAISSPQQWDSAAHDDGLVTASALPTSWTASGLLAAPHVCMMTSGAYSGGWFWPMADMGTKAARVSQVVYEDGFVDTYSQGAYEAAATFTVHTMTKLTGRHFVHALGQGQGLFFFDVDFGEDADVHTSACLSGSPFFVRCNVSSMDIDGDASPQFIGCRIARLHVYTIRPVNAQGAAFMLDTAIRSGVLQPWECALQGTLRLIEDGARLAITDGFAVFDGANPITMAPGSKMLLQGGTLWGTGASGAAAISMGADCRVVKPAGTISITGTQSVDVIVGTTSRTFAQLPYTDTASGAAVLPA